MGRKLYDIQTGDEIRVGDQLTRTGVKYLIIRIHPENNCVTLIILGPLIQDPCVVDVTPLGLEFR